MIPKEEAELADIDPARHAYIDRPDLGMVGYAAIPEALHQMHCVNTLRQSLYYNIEHTRKNCALPHCIPGKDAEEGNRLHIGEFRLFSHLIWLQEGSLGRLMNTLSDHCLELIRLRIECTADLGIGKWTTNSPLPVIGHSSHIRSICHLIPVPPRCTHEY